MSTPPVVLSVAGTDSGGAAGLAADLATFAAHDVHGALVVTAVTAQDTTGVHAVHEVPLAVVEAQVAAVLDDLPVAAAKTGMLGTPDVVGLLAERLAPRLPLVVDPVLVATSGAVLGGAEVARAYVERLLPVAAVATPNADEARALLRAAGHPADAVERLGPAALAGALTALGCAVVLTGGPDLDRPDEVVDLVAVPGRPVAAVTHPVVATSHDHGTGCTHSAALAAGVARGLDPLEAARRAASYVHRQLRTSASWGLGRGRGPVAHTHPAHPERNNP